MTGGRRPERRRRPSGRGEGGRGGPACAGRRGRHRPRPSRPRPLGRRGGLGGRRRGLTLRAPAGGGGRSRAPCARPPRRRVLRRGAPRSASRCGAACVAPRGLRAATRRSERRRGRAPGTAAPRGAFARAAAPRRALGGPSAGGRRGARRAPGSTGPHGHGRVGSARTAPPSIPSPLRPPSRLRWSSDGRVAVGRGWGQFKPPRWGPNEAAVLRELPRWALDAGARCQRRVRTLPRPEVRHHAPA